MRLDDATATIHNKTVSTLQWRRIKVMYSQIICHPPVCLTVVPDPHQQNIKVRITGPMWGEFAGEFPRTKGQQRGKSVHFMTPSCFVIRYSPVTYRDFLVKWASRHINSPADRLFVDVPVMGGGGGGGGGLILLSWAICSSRHERKYRTPHHWHVVTETGD